MADMYYTVGSAHFINHKVLIVDELKGLLTHKKFTFEQLVDMDNTGILNAMEKFSVPVDENGNGLELFFICHDPDIYSGTNDARWS